jgi:hypothetical protein
VGSVVTTRTLSLECRQWAQLAGYGWDVDTGRVYRGSAHGPEFYQLQFHAAGRVEVFELDEDAMRPLLYAATVNVVEHYLFGVFGDDIRDDLGLPYHDLPAGQADLARDYSLSTTSNGRHVLANSAGPVAATSDAALSLITLVPLSHYLGLPLRILKRAFLDEKGAPLLSGGRYARTSG